MHKVTINILFSCPVPSTKEQINRQTGKYKSANSWGHSSSVLADILHLYHSIDVCIYHVLCPIKPHGKSLDLKEWLKKLV